jgi:hypothetical protein
MKKSELYASADLIGRLKVIYALQMANPDLEITSMSITSRYDLRVHNPKKGTTEYLEIKDRDCEEDKYDNAFLNIEKYNALSGYGESFWYVCSYNDNKMDFWQPTVMPRSGITEGEYMIRTSTVENTARKRQKRYQLNFNDKSLQLTNKIQITKI